MTTALQLLSPSTPSPPNVAGEADKGKKTEEEEDWSLFELIFTLFRKSLVGSCTTEKEEEEGRRTPPMEIGWPSDVRHVAHVTFDRFHGFLGLPSELQPEVPTRAPSASATVFGVSTESMQCSYDSRGNSVPTILLMLQKRLYSQRGLQAEGIFRITAENSEEEHVRDQLNSGIVPEDIDVHCLAGLIKAWFRELPDGVLDSLTPEQVMQSQSEDDYVQLVRLLPPTEAALLDWAVNLMADVVQEEQHNKMNEHNIATVFAPNMTQMADPLNALMHAVQVMNLLKTLILKVIRERKESSNSGASTSWADPPNEGDDQSPTRVKIEDSKAPNSTSKSVQEKTSRPQDSKGKSEDATPIMRRNISHRKAASEVSDYSIDDQPSRPPLHIRSTSGSEGSFDWPRARPHANSRKKKAIQCQSLALEHPNFPMKTTSIPRSPAPIDKPKDISTLSRIYTRNEREEWR